ncbi:1897_t:CDS:2, partial [Entrophospora sp. SA101]
MSRFCQTHVPLQKFLAENVSIISNNLDTWVHLILQDAKNILLSSFSFSKSFVRNYASEHIVYNLPKEDTYTGYECEPPSLEVQITKEEIVHMYKQMVIMRRMEVTSDGLYKSKFIRGFCHLCTGQEAVSVGMESAITPEDAVITAYRCHGYTMVRGRKTGISKGKGGSMHMFAKNFYGGNGIVPVGAGIAFTQKYNNTNNATFILYGDGAANQGQVFESYNMAKLWNLPAIFVCENNFYGMGTSIDRSSANTRFYTRGQYIPGLKVNGMDVMAVKNACSWAKDWTVSGKGPLVMEMVTYRYGGHSMSDPGTTYRTREEIQHMRSINDPITKLKQRIIDIGLLTETELKQVEKEARTILEDASKKAQSDPLPDESELYTNVYVKGSNPPSIRGREREEFGI